MPLEEGLTPMEVVEPSLTFFREFFLIKTGFFSWLVLDSSSTDTTSTFNNSKMVGTRLASRMSSSFFSSLVREFNSYIMCLKAFMQRAVVPSLKILP